MKILHIVFPLEYLEGWGYQENLLPAIQSKMGNDVYLLTSNMVDRLGIREKHTESSYINKDGVKVTRVRLRSFPYIIQKKLQPFTDFYEYLCQVNPDIIFLHDPVGPSNYIIKKYKQKFPHVIILADSHSDYINSGSTWISRNVLHKIIHRHYYHVLSPICEKFYGTLPMRCDFIREMYRLPEDKIDYLPMGFDDSRVDVNKRGIIRQEIREQLGIAENVTVFVTGGRLEKRKKTIELLQAFCKIQNNNIRLLVFGEPSEDISLEFSDLTKNDRIITLGWIDSKEIYKYYFASDVAFFSGTHSVLWEQAVACGLPCVFTKWPGMDYLDLGGNCIFISACDIDSLERTLVQIIQDPQMVDSMKKVAIEKGWKAFAYTSIAKKIMDDCGMEN